MISRGYAGLPPSARGQRIGLFGGSFNPPHEGHRAASLIALRRLRLDRIWWLVTTGNPLKDTRDLSPVAERIETGRRLAAHPDIDVTGFESRLGSPYTCDLVADLMRRCPQVHFVLVVGADSFATFHQWKHWRRIVDLVPIAVVDRPGFTVRTTQAHAAIALRWARHSEVDAAALAGAKPPAFVFLHGPRSSLSSTALRGQSEGGPTTTL